MKVASAFVHRAHSIISIHLQTGFKGCQQHWPSLDLTSPKKGAPVLSARFSTDNRLSLIRWEGHYSSLLSNEGVPSLIFTARYHCPLYAGYQFYYHPFQNSNKKHSNDWDLVQRDRTNKNEVPLEMTIFSECFSLFLSRKSPEKRKRLCLCQCTMATVSSDCCRWDR